jgi:cysteine synthase A
MSCFEGLTKGSNKKRTCLIYDDITKTVGCTPIVKINKIAPPGVEVYAKLEYFNPLSSVKDRLANAIIEDAEAKGLLGPGKNNTVVEATSGNTGIALAMVCAQRGYNFVAVMAASFSVERRKVMRALGARVVITPAPLGGTGMVKKAEELAEKHGFLLARQFETAANPAYHEKTTGPEILEAFEGKKLDYWVTGYGTGGTFTGAGRAMKKARPDLKVVLSEPTAAPLVSSGVPQERKEVLGEFGAPAAGHPKWTAHPIQGWTPNFIPNVCQMGLDSKVHDEIVLVDGKDAMATALRLMKEEGIFCGTSGGATMATALEVAKKAPPGSVILAMIPDTAERYLSTPLFAAVEEKMTPEEIELGKTTATPIID